MTASLLYVGHNCIGQKGIFIPDIFKKRLKKKKVTGTIAISICPSYAEILDLCLLPTVFLAVLIFTVIY